MPLSTRSLVPLAALALALVASAARAQSPRLVSADDHGVTFRVDVPQWRLDPDSLTHRMKLVAPGFDGLSEPGRAFLPATSTLIALPPGARASATIVAMGDEELHANVALTYAGRPGWEGGGSRGLGLQPTIEEVPPVLDGPWPVAQIELGEPFTVRHQRMVAVRVMPFRYDEATGRLWVRRSLTVRVTFTSSPGTALRPISLGEGAPDATMERALLNPEQGRRFRSAATPARPALRLAPRAGAQGVAAFGFDEDQPEVRVKVDTTGVLGLLEDDLEASGFPTGVPIAEVSVHRHEFLENSTPPYATVEIPCEVVDYNSNNVFDSGDAIYVYAQTWLARARPSMWQRQWGDADYVFATRVSGRAGLRMSTRAGWRGATGLTPLASYPLTTHYEHDSGDRGDFFALPPDTLTDVYPWVAALRYYARPDTFLFNANDLDTTRAARFAIQYVGRRTELRMLWAQTRNGLGQLTTVLDSVTMFGTTTSTFTVSAPGSVLTDGRNNLKVWARLYPTPPDPVVDPAIATAFNWFEVTHWRGFRAIQGYLPCTSADGDGEYQVKADRFASNAIEVWDVTDSTQAVRLQVDPSHIVQAAGRWSVEFQDSTASAQPRRYVVFDTPRYALPEAYGAVTRRPLTGGPTSYDYLLVIPGAWESAVAPLVAAREAQGLRVLVAPYEAIRDQFNGGRPSAHAVKRLIRYAYNNWNTKYVALMGDAGGIDGRQRYPASSIEWIPTMMIQSPVGVTVGNEFGFELIPSDSWYGWCVDPDCIPTPDPRVTPGLHDVYVGRLPVNSVAEAADIAKKLAAYDTVSAGQTWRREMTLLADDLYSGDLFGQFNSTTYCRHNYEAVFEDLNRRSADIILNEAGLAQSSPEVFSMAQYLANEDTVLVGGTVCRPNASVTEQHTRAAVTPLLVSRLNAGKLWWNYHGHANQLLLSHEWIWMSQGSTDDWRQLANTDRPFFFSAFSCHANLFTDASERDPTFGLSVGEELIDAPRTGAIASWASTGFELIPSQNPNLSHISLELTRALFSRVPPDTSLVQRGQGDPYAHPVLGDAIALALMKWVPQVLNSAGERNVGLSYELLGDPATRISIAAPQSFVTANGLAVTSGQAVRLHTLGDTVRVVADLVSNQALTRLRIDRVIAGVQDTIAVGDYSITPSFPDTAFGGLGGRRYQITYFTSLQPRSTTFTFRATDRQGVATSFDVAFPFQTVLRSEGIAIPDGDVVPPTANLTLLMLCPAPVATPQTSYVVRINGVDQTITATPNAGDASGREHVLAWTHSPYPVGDYTVEVLLDGALVAAHTFKVTITSGELQLVDAMLFPNPFEDELGAYFSFNLESGSPADVLIRVYTVTGRLIYRRFERQLAPGYHQLPWDGRDAEGDKLANGVYFYRLQADNGASNATYEGRLVKLRRPHRLVEPTTP